MMDGSRAESNVAIKQKPNYGSAPLCFVGVYTVGVAGQTVDLLALRPRVVQLHQLPPIYN